jgi:hypothetical protein
MADDDTGGGLPELIGAIPPKPLPNLGFIADQPDVYEPPVCLDKLQDLTSRRRHRLARRSARW